MHVVSYRNSKTAFPIYQLNAIEHKLEWDLHSDSALSWQITNLRASVPSPGIWILTSQDCCAPSMTVQVKHCPCCTCIIGVTIIRGSNLCLARSHLSTVLPLASTERDVIDSYLAKPLQWWAKIMFQPFYPNEGIMHIQTVG